jgi:hypothetical protein
MLCRIDYCSWNVLSGVSEKTCPNSGVSVKADPNSPPGFHAFECPKCAFVRIETIKEEPPPRPVGGPRTRGEALSFSLSFALMKATKIVRGLSKGLSDDDRRAVVAETLRLLRKNDGDRWQLDEPLPETMFQGHMSGHRLSG